MFPLTAKTKFTDQMIPILNNSLILFDEKLNHYFLLIDLKLFDWVRNPFSSNLETTQLSLIEEEELTELKNDRTHQMKLNEFKLGKFWIFIKKRIFKVIKINTFYVTTMFHIILM